MSSTESGKRIRELESELAEANDRWHSACDVGRRMEVRLNQVLGELAETRAKLESMTNWCASAKPARKTPAEQAVLDAMLRLEDEDLDVFAGSDQDQHDRLVSFADAIELARREEKTNE